MTSSFTELILSIRAIPEDMLITQINILFEKIARLEPESTVAAWQTLSLISHEAEGKGKTLADFCLSAVEGRMVALRHLPGPDGISSWGQTFDAVTGKKIRFL